MCWGIFREGRRKAVAGRELRRHVGLVRSRGRMATSIAVPVSLTDSQTGAAHAHTGAWVARVLRERIAAGRLVAGQKLSEQVLADTMRVSRNTLREAFATLAGESIVNRIPNRGVFVAQPDADDVREIYAVRRIIEPGAVLWSAPGPAQIAALEHSVAGVARARDEADIAAMADANQALHKAIIDLAGSQSLVQLMARLLARMRLIFYTMASATDFHSHYVDHNIALVACIRRGERETGAAMLRDYLATAEAELLRHMENAAAGLD